MHPDLEKMHALVSQSCHSQLDQMLNVVKTTADPQRQSGLAWVFNCIVFVCQLTHMNSTSSTRSS